MLDGMTSPCRRAIRDEWRCSNTREVLLAIFRRSSSGKSSLQCRMSERFLAAYSYTRVGGLASKQIPRSLVMFLWTTGDMMTIATLLRNSSFPASYLSKYFFTATKVLSSSVPL
ncbi:Os11g0556433 [Oryza sativa Japonica Group]|uniref:Os11g0556433 protein n=1 Tax=Oryza sativa subsp. japonica TaxID=39947 RepID=A0A0P0Y3A4_ORYSJ|nr:hypothetical protein EE612_056128 [Oryza sativa]BAT14447.1 Os11g0556433 [Oryza sativa Japonica Group]